jgi:MscS family membrane protein
MFVIRALAALSRRALHCLLLIACCASVQTWRIECASADPLNALSQVTGKLELPAANGTPANAPSAPAVAPDSARAALTEFFNLTQEGDYEKAAHYLDLSLVDPGDGPILAEHLREVLDRHLRLEASIFSATSLGDPEDEQAPSRELLGNVPDRAGKPEPVILERRLDARGVLWVFSARTVAHVQEWYAQLENRWLLEHLPKRLLNFGPHELRWWQWLGLIPLLAVSYSIAFVITRLSRVLLRRLLSARGAENARRMRAPAALAWTVAAGYALLPFLALYEPGEAFVRRGLSAALLIAFFWALWRTVDLSRHAVSASRWANSSLTAHALLMLGARLGKFVVASFAFVAVLADLGYPVTSLITGLGIGGIALALAAQKTVENLFGAFSLAVDQPFREGDTIQVDTVAGTVESIGLRSTRIRTVDRTLISIPNGKLAEMRIETMSARDQIRFYSPIALVHSAAPRMLEVLSGIERVLSAEPRIEPGSVSVCFVGISESALNIDASALCQTTNFGEFLQMRQALLLGILQTIAAAGAELAQPARKIEIVERVSSTATGSKCWRDEH